MIIYESPHRIAKALSEALEVFGPSRRACIAREISKIYETYHRGSLEELVQLVEERAIKGEIVLIIEGERSANKSYRD